MTRRSYGSGSIDLQRPGYWRLRVMAHDPITGKPKQISRGFRGNKKQAQQALSTLVSEVSTGRQVATEGTVAYLMQRWLAHAGPDLAENTLRRYEIAARNHIIPALGTIQLRKLRTSDLDALYGRMRAAGDAPASIQKVHAVMRRALDQARRWKWVPENVALDASPPKVPKSEITPPSVTDVGRMVFAAEASHPDFGMFLRLAAATGCRRGELCALRWCDVDLEQGTVHVSRAVIASGRIKDTKTHQARTVSVDADTVVKLAAHKARLLEAADVLDASYGEDAYLFSADPAGTKPWNPSTPTHQFTRLRRRLGLEGRLHDLRHWSVTQQLTAGVPVITVAGRHGHAGGGRTTQAIYGHFLQATDRAAADIMGELLRERKGAPPPG